MEPTRPFFGPLAEGSARPLRGRPLTGALAPGPRLTGGPHLSLRFAPLEQGDCRPPVCPPAWLDSVGVIKALRRAASPSVPRSVSEGRTWSIGSWRLSEAVA